MTTHYSRQYLQEMARRTLKQFRKLHPKQFLKLSRDIPWYIRIDDDGKAYLRIVMLPGNGSEETDTFWEEFSLR